MKPNVFGHGDCFCRFNTAPFPPSLSPLTPRREGAKGRELTLYVRVGGGYYSSILTF